MGEQIHVGRLASSQDLAARAGIRAGTRGVDLCCCTGAGMRFLLRFRNVAHMIGVDATEAMIELGRSSCKEEGRSLQTEFVLADACASGLPDGSVDFAWGEDAWCYLMDKSRLVAEAVRMVRPAGTIAFTDWMTGPGLAPDEAERFLRFMKFPNLPSLEDYKALMENQRCTIQCAEDTGRFESHVRLYLEMLDTKLAYDALKIVGFNEEIFEAIVEELRLVRNLAQAAKVIQGIVVAVKP
jgi:ubiquinone/menaquinone biosynthesis C-methylase UbiE